MKIKFNKNLCKIFILALFMLVSPLALNGKPAIALIKGMYDDIGLILNNYKIPYNVIILKDLENPETMAGYGSIFFPSGIEKPVYENIDLLSMGTKIKSVNLKKDYYQLNDKKIFENIKNFIENGGSAYFSGYSYKYIQELFSPFEFFENFPYIGLPGKITASLNYDLKRFSNSNSAQLYFSYPGWVAVKSAVNSEIVAEAEFETPRGNRSGPITLLLHRGKGEILFTSYYGANTGDFRRFNIYRIAGINLIKNLIKKAEYYEQSVTDKITDSIQQNENYRLYSLTLRKGNNTIYLLSENDYYQIDIFDGKKNLITSIDRFEKFISFDIKSDMEDNCFIKILPSTDRRFGMYAIMSSFGPRYIPYYKKVIIVSMVIISLSLFILIITLIRGKRIF